MHRSAGAALLMSHFKNLKPAGSAYPTANYRNLFLSHFPVTLRNFACVFMASYGVVHEGKWFFGRALATLTR
jgi:hypothetical protein